MLGGEQTFERELPIRQLTDVHPYAMTALGVAGGLGVSAAVMLFSPENMSISIAVFLATAILMLPIYFFFCRPKQLRQYATHLTLGTEKNAVRIPLDRIYKFSSEWTDLQRNGVYQTTFVRFRFLLDGQTRPLEYRGSAMYQTTKYEEFEALQSDIAEAVSQKLWRQLQATGRVEWTARITLLPDEIEFQRSPQSEVRRVRYDRITATEVDRGVFKLAIDGSDSPNIVEPTNQYNFWSGFPLFQRLQEKRTPILAEHESLHSIVL